jgi:hypothetical protein
MKKCITIVFIALLALSLAACNGGAEPADATHSTAPDSSTTADTTHSATPDSSTTAAATPSVTPDTAPTVDSVATLIADSSNGSSEPNQAATTETPPADNASWFGYFGTLTRRESSQYNNATLQVKGLEDGVAIFEFDLMEGSESEDRASALQIAGTMLIESVDAGMYECLNEDGGSLYSIRFERSEDGMQITVTHTGDIPMNPDGEYDWIDWRVESDAGLAAALLENLPTAATSLNSNLGAYTIHYPEESVLNYFYPVTATFDDTGAALAEFLICADLSAVWRLDTEDGVPALIYGTAQDMLDMVVYPTPEEDSDGDGAIPDPDALLEHLLKVIVEGGAFMKPGDSAKLTLDSPYPFPCSFSALSTDEAVATVDDSGVITAHNPGTATIFGGYVYIGEAKRGFTVELTVGAEGEPGEARPDADAASETEEVVGS